ncbi:hypothetical protein Tco_1255192 [Tanacetum coccineum]
MIKDIQDHSFLGLPRRHLAAVDMYCETAKEIWLRVKQMIEKVLDSGIQGERWTKLFNEWERFTSTEGNRLSSYYHRFSKLLDDFKRMLVIEWDNVVLGITIQESKWEWIVVAASGLRVNATGNNGYQIRTHLLIAQRKKLESNSSEELDLMAADSRPG